METARTNIIGHRVRTARASCGLSTREVAIRLREFGIVVSHTTVGSYERGLTDIPASILSAFSRLLGRSVDWLLGQGGAFSEARYRALKKTEGDSRAAFEALATGYAELYLEAEERLGRPLTGCPISVREKETVVQVASRLREVLRVGPDQPLRSVIWMLEKTGVRVFDLEGPEGIDAFAANFDGIPFVILNSRLSPDRMRITAGHELGHHVFQDCHEGMTLPEDEIESRAFELGGTLLMPDDVLKSAIEHRSIVRMVQFKERYGISLAAMIVRARKKGWLSAGTYERLWKEFSRLGWRKAGGEPGKVQPDRPTRLEVLIDSAIRNSKMTLAECASIACVKSSEIEARLSRAMGEDPTMALLDGEDARYSISRRLSDRGLENTL